ncbi:hypothetical protein LTR53_011309 [Teratosphaeriaceae sp. CCFEE 6253]|nr:hypothetical protein LTR53_011309 [Teratosphaeriaceae sp. CCFEE 6253]
MSNIRWYWNQSPYSVPGFTDYGYSYQCDNSGNWGAWDAGYRGWDGYGNGYDADGYAMMGDGYGNWDCRLQPQMSPENLGPILECVHHIALDRALVMMGYPPLH